VKHVDGKPLAPVDTALESVVSRVRSIDDPLSRPPLRNIFSLHPPPPAAALPPLLHGPKLVDARTDHFTPPQPDCPPKSTPCPAPSQSRRRRRARTPAASLSAGAVVFGIQMLVFLILSGNWKLHKTKRSGDDDDKKAERQGLFHKI
jgi:hypothetical protein